MGYEQREKSQVEESLGSSHNMDHQSGHGKLVDKMLHSHSLASNVSYDADVAKGIYGQNDQVKGKVDHIRQPHDCVVESKDREKVCFVTSMFQAGRLFLD